MYMKSPMENYNKNNPFIIIAKKTYDTIIDTLHNFTKLYIRNIIIIGLICAISIGVNIFTFCFTLNYPNIIASVLSIVSFLLLYFGFKRELAYFINGNQAMMSFEKLANLEVNAILTLNNEDILNCVNTLYSLLGEIRACIRYFKYFSVAIIVLNIVVTIITCV